MYNVAGNAILGEITGGTTYTITTSVERSIAVGALTNAAQTYIPAGKILYEGAAGMTNYQASEGQQMYDVFNMMGAAIQQSGWLDVDPGVQTDPGAIMRQSCWPSCAQ